MGESGLEPAELDEPLEVEFGENPVTVEGLAGETLGQIQAAQGFLAERSGPANTTDPALTGSAQELDALEAETERIRVRIAVSGISMFPIGSRHPRGLKAQVLTAEALTGEPYIQAAPQHGAHDSRGVAPENVVSIDSIWKELEDSRKTGKVRPRDRLIYGSYLRARSTLEVLRVMFGEDKIILHHPHERYTEGFPNATWVEIGPRSPFIDILARGYGGLRTDFRVVIDFFQLLRTQPDALMPLAATEDFALDLIRYIASKNWAVPLIHFQPWRPSPHEKQTRAALLRRQNQLTDFLNAKPDNYLELALRTFFESFPHLRELITVVIETAPGPKMFKVPAIARRIREIAADIPF